MIILLWNTSKEDSRKKGCKVEKARQGMTGKVALEFDGEHMRFKESNGSTDFEYNVRQDVFPEFMK